MRPSSYHDRNRYVNKPVIINNISNSPPASLLPRARIINTSTPSILRPTIRHSSYGRTTQQIPYYQPATIIHSRNNRNSSYHHHHHRHHPDNYQNIKHQHHTSSYHHHHHNKYRGRTRDRHHHRHHNKYNDDKSGGRSRSRNRDKRYNKINTKTMNHNINNKNKSILDNRFSSKPNEATSKDKVIEITNEFANKYQLTMNKYYKEILETKINNYYNTAITPRFMIENDEIFRNRIERLKGLNAYKFNTFIDEFDDDSKLQNKLHSKKGASSLHSKKHKKTEKSSKLYDNNNNHYNHKNKMDKKRSKSKSKKDDKSIFNSKGKSSMNYKFRAFKKSNQPNSFVQTEEDDIKNKDNKTNLNINTSSNYNSRYHHHSGNIHVNDDDIYIDRTDQIDMNELINGLVYSKQYQDHRIGTLNTAQNDYSQYFVDTRKRPQNFIRELQHIERLKEYPKLRKLMQSKNEALRKISITTPPFYINADLKQFDLLTLQAKFDVILVDPPWKFYVDRCPGAVENLKRTPWTFEEMNDLRIQDIAENPSFVFLWCGSGNTLNDGRQLLKKWGYKRCEVIVWLKTNKKNKIKIGLNKEHSPSDNINNYLLEKNEGYLIGNEYDGKNYDSSLFVRSYEHCLMGIKGQVRRSTDGHLIHANVDTDVIITESAPYGSTMKPNELYDIIERFCLGRKRLELFGCTHNLRPGWLTISNSNGVPLNSNFDPIYYNSLFIQQRYLPSTNEIEALRPKSPIRNNSKNKGKSNNNNITTSK